MAGQNWRWIAGAAIIAALAFMGGQIAPNLLPPNWELGRAHGSYSSLNDLVDILKQKFDGPVDQAKLLDGAKAGLVSGLGDPYTDYLDAQAAKDLSNQLQGTLSGIGAEVGIKNNRLTVIAPVSGSPAETAGLRAGDIIAKINGQDTTGMLLDDAVSKIRGQAGSKVTLTIVRGSNPPKELNITRQVITVPSVKWSMKNGDTGYIQISEFGSDTSSKIQQAADELSSQGAKKVILDLRNDPGGYLDAAQNVASQFLPSGNVVVEERAHGQTREKLTSNAGGKLVGLPVVVLINEGSASASEIVAGALHDDIHAKLIGQKSFGKGSVQEITPLAGGAELKVTVAHWFTPAGKSIDKQGIQPDISVAQTEDDFNAGRDPQLDRALAELGQ